MNNVKSIFSIKDLENLSGIKAHTIRIWEKRYNILEPKRTDTNIRYYDLVSLQKLLNITLLHNHGYKISKISKLSADKLTIMVREIINDKSVKNHVINSFKIAMINFDQTLFSKTYSELLSEKSFSKVFNEVFLTLLDEIGLLWQSSTISPAQEHFISYLIKQKLLVNTERIQAYEPTKTDCVFVLFLPENEIHELGLLYLNYEILLNGYKTIYLGENIPISSLKELRRHFETITYITYMTVQPAKDEVNNYINELHQEIIDGENSNIWAIGRNAEFINQQLHPKVTVFNSIHDLVANLQTT